MVGLFANFLVLFALDLGVSTIFYGSFAVSLHLCRFVFTDKNNNNNNNNNNKMIIEKKNIQHLIAHLNKYL